MHPLTTDLESAGIQISRRHRGHCYYVPKGISMNHIDRQNDIISHDALIDLLHNQQPYLDYRDWVSSTTVWMCDIEASRQGSRSSYYSLMLFDVVNVYSVPTISPYFESSNITRGISSQHMAPHCSLIRAHVKCVVWPTVARRGHSDSKDLVVAIAPSRHSKSGPTSNTTKTSYLRAQLHKLGMENPEHLIRQMIIVNRLFRWTSFTEST